MLELPGSLSVSRRPDDDFLPLQLNTAFLRCKRLRSYCSMGAQLLVSLTYPLSFSRFVFLCGMLGVRPPSRAVFDPRVGLVTAQLESLSLMGGGGGMGVGVAGGSGGVAAGRVLVHEAKLVGPPEKNRKLRPQFPIVCSTRTDRAGSVALVFFSCIVSINGYSSLASPARSAASRFGYSEGQKRQPLQYFARRDKCSR